MKYTFELRPEDKDDEGELFMITYDYMCEVIEDDIKLELNYGVRYHDEIMIDVKIDKEEDLERFLITLKHMEWPTPEVVEPYGREYFKPIFTVKEMKGNTAKVELEFEEYYDGRYIPEVNFKLEVK